MDKFASIRAKIDSARSLGYRKLANGAELVGHVPHIAPEAWLHVLFPPLTTLDIDELGSRVGIKLPQDLCDFYACSNGLDLFSSALAIFGKRTNYSRIGDDAWQPFCIVTANTLDRPHTAKSWQLVVGSYESDGSLLSIDTTSGRIFKTSGRSSKVLSEWPNLWAALDAESNRLAAKFDNLGRRMADD